MAWGSSVSTRKESFSRSGSSGTWRLSWSNCKAEATLAFVFDSNKTGAASSVIRGAAPVLFEPGSRLEARAMQQRLVTRVIAQRVEQRVGRQPAHRRLPLFNADVQPLESRVQIAHAAVESSKIGRRDV